MSLWIAVALCGLVSAALRVVFVAGNRRIPVPQWFDGASRLIARHSPEPVNAMRSQA